MKPTVAALYVEANGVYSTLDDVDLWPVGRDARRYDGPYPVVAHPPCERWGMLARANESKYGLKVGDDHGCFEAALTSVWKWGGVLEHPAHSLAWAYFGLRRPEPGRWLIDGPCGWVTQVSQVAYGHAARKRTWLYVESRSMPLPLDWSEPDASGQVSTCGKGRPKRRQLKHSEALATPRAFALELLTLARDVVR